MTVHPERKKERKTGGYLWHHHLDRQQWTPYRGKWRGGCSTFDISVQAPNRSNPITPKEEKGGGT
jgi:hypothetical protein